LKGSISLCGSSVGGLLSGDPERYGEEGSGDGHHPMGVHSLGTLIVVRGVWKWGISLSMGALLGEPGGGGSFARGPEGYERKALGMGIPLYGV